MAGPIAAPPAGAAFRQTSIGGDEKTAEPGSTTVDGQVVGPDGSESTHVPAEIPASGRDVSTETFTRSSSTGGGVNISGGSNSGGQNVTFGPTTVVQAGVERLDSGNVNGDVSSDMAKAKREAVKQNNDQISMAHQNLQKLSEIRAPLIERANAKAANVSRLEGKEDLSKGEKAELSRDRTELAALRGNIAGVDSIIDKTKNDITDLEKTGDRLEREVTNAENAQKAEQNRKAKQEDKKDEAKAGAKDSVIASANKNAANAAQVGAPGAPQSAKPIGTPSEQTQQAVQEEVIQGKARGGAT